jgi:hypothetical protein
MQLPSCQRIALPSCAAAALGGHHCARPLRCSCQCLELPPLRCPSTTDRYNHLRSRPTQMLRPPPLVVEQSKSGGDIISYHDLGEIRWKVPKDFPVGKTLPRCADRRADVIANTCVNWLFPEPTPVARVDQFLLSPIFWDTHGGSGCRPSLEQIIKNLFTVYASTIIYLYNSAS